MNLSEHNKWLNSQQFKPGTSAEICQCGTEKAIQRSLEPERMRAELLSYIFLDQFIFSHYPQNHAAFKREYPGPNLRQHSFGGHASPSWFIYSRHGYDSNADWQLIQSTLHEYLNGGLQWLKQRCDIDKKNYWHLTQKEIKSEFEDKHHSKLLIATQNVL